MSLPEHLLKVEVCRTPPDQLIRSQETPHKLDGTQSSGWWEECRLPAGTHTLFML